MSSVKHVLVGSPAACSIFAPNVALSAINICLLKNIFRGRHLCCINWNIFKLLVCCVDNIPPTLDPWVFTECSTVAAAAGRSTQGTFLGCRLSSEMGLGGPITHYHIPGLEAEWCPLWQEDAYLHKKKANRIEGFPLLLQRTQSAPSCPFCHSFISPLVCWLLGQKGPGFESDDKISSLSESFSLCCSSTWRCCSLSSPRWAALQPSRPCSVVTSRKLPPPLQARLAASSAPQHWFLFSF